MSKERTGGKVNYYLAQVTNPQRTDQAPYQAECEDIIQALGMTFDEGCEFKAIWRTAAARMGLEKDTGKGLVENALYDAQKRVHYAQRSVKEYKAKLDAKATQPTGWITWESKDNKCPVFPSTKVEVRFRSGTSITSIAPEQINWSHLNGSGDVVAYRVID
ncbi:polynucleotide kinase [Burkholderia phage vB_BpP_HN03]|uniref:Uncharacterized protein n=1 Tax=Burkholderia phage vB_BpP_HN02 TaxID=3116925 RepID=A0AAX4JGX6_9CAUD